VEFPLLCQSGSSELPVGKVLAAEAVYNGGERASLCGAGAGNARNGECPRFAMAVSIRAGGRRAVCAFGGLPRHARDRSQALGGTLPRTGDQFLVEKSLLPPEPARMLRGWVHSGFNVHRGRRVLSREREDMERLAQYIIRNPFSVEKMRASEPGPASASGSILYRSGMNILRSGAS
jgi:hypothetical protein